MLGAGLFGANLSSIFRLRQFGMADKTPYSVAIQLEHEQGGWAGGLAGGWLEHKQGGWAAGRVARWVARWARGWVLLPAEHVFVPGNRQWL